MIRIGILSILLLSILCLTLHACHGAKVPGKLENKDIAVYEPQPGAWDTKKWFPMVKGKKVGVVCNHTATIGITHVVDSMIRAGIQVKRIFSPEHGFRGDLPDGYHIGDAIDKATGLPIISLYGDNKKPDRKHLEDLDVLLFDIQDVGVRCYTFISTLHYIMESCAETDVPLIILDRPNPNGHYVDGPLLNPAFRSFVGMHPVPLVYGMTIGEYGQMIKGEQWINQAFELQLTVIPIKNYNRKLPYYLNKPPSPNLPNMRAVWLYPSLVLFEGTQISIGRGTEMPFQLIGHPELTQGDTYFIPVSRPESTNPPLLNKQCRGWDLSDKDPESIFRESSLTLDWLQKAYRAYERKDSFFLKTGMFDKLAGTDKLRKQFESQMTSADIKATWTADLEEFKRTRAKYLLYPD